MDIVQDVITHAGGFASLALHRSAYVPNDQEAVAIREAADELRVLADSLSENDSISPAAATALAKQITLHDALVAPCRRLPPEILSEIFLLALPEDWERGYAGIRVLNIARVCVSWRYIALKTPRIWTSLRFGPETNPLANHISALRDELDKTAQAPLELVIDMDLDNMRFPDFEPPRFDEVWSDEAWALLCAQSHRLRYLDLNKVPMTAYSKLAECTFPRLEVLLIGVCEDDDDKAIRLPIDAFSQAEKITDLCIGYATPILTFELPRMWPLTELNLSSTESSFLGPSIDAILSCSATLRVCHVTAEERATEPVVRTPTVFPHLEMLSLSHYAITLCYAFTVPNLQTLDLTSLPEPSVDQFDALKSMLVRSGDCKALHSLSLEALEPSPDAGDAIDCLSHIRHLRKLALKNNQWTEEESLLSLRLIQPLVRDPAVPASMSFLPHLTHLVVDFGLRDVDAHDPEFGSALSDVLKSRRTVRTVGGVELALLEHFETNGGEADCRWPPPA